MLRWALAKHPMHPRTTYPRTHASMPAVAVPDQSGTVIWERASGLGLYRSSSEGAGAGVDEVQAPALDGGLRHRTRLSVCRPASLLAQ